jgi:hypothetical protein
MLPDIPWIVSDRREPRRRENYRPCPAARISEPQFSGRAPGLRLALPGGLGAGRSAPVRSDLGQSLNTELRPVVLIARPRRISCTLDVRNDDVDRRLARRQGCLRQRAGISSVVPAVLVERQGMTGWSPYSPTPCDVRPKEEKFVSHFVLDIEVPIQGDHRLTC